MKRFLLTFQILIISIIITALSVLSAGALVVNCEEYPDFTFCVDFFDESGVETYAVNSYTGINPNPVIPPNIGSHIIKRFGEKSFYNNEIVKSVTMSDNIASVRSWAIRNCSNLKSVYFSKNLVVLYDYSFAYNPILNSALLRNTNINQIAKGAFSDDYSLRYISLPDTLERIDELAFYKCSFDTIVLPPNIKKMGSYTFAENSHLKSVYIPTSVTSIGKNVFNGCPNVTVYCTENSYALEYCVKNQISHNIIGADEYPSFINGDVNSDGILNVRDVTAIQKELVNLDNVICFSHNADVNCDCEINVRDVTALQRYLVKLDL